MYRPPSGSATAYEGKLRPSALSPPLLAMFVMKLKPCPQTHAAAGNGGAKVGVAVAAGVVVRVGVAVGVGLRAEAPRSNAPMPQPVPWRRATPGWSVARQRPV